MIMTALPRNDIGLLLWLVAGMVLVAVLSAVLGAARVIVNSRIGQMVLHDLRVRLYAHLQSLSLRFFTGTRVGERAARQAFAEGLSEGISKGVPAFRNADRAQNYR